jgi:hypothetical protein
MTALVTRMTIVGSNLLHCFANQGQRITTGKRHTLSIDCRLANRLSRPTVWRCVQAYLRCRFWQSHNEDAQRANPSSIDGRFATGAPFVTTRRWRQPGRPQVLCHHTVHPSYDPAYQLSFLEHNRFPAEDVGRSWAKPPVAGIVATCLIEMPRLL